MFGPLEGQKQITGRMMIKYFHSGLLKAKQHRTVELKQSAIFPQR